MSNEKPPLEEAAESQDDFRESAERADANILEHPFLTETTVKETDTGQVITITVTDLRKLPNYGRPVGRVIGENHPRKGELVEFVTSFITSRSQEGGLWRYEDGEVDVLWIDCLNAGPESNDVEVIEQEA